MNDNIGELFELTKEITDGIIFAMEDQQSDWILDSSTGVVHPCEITNSDTINDSVTNTEISLPSWSPADGFRLMENFTASIHNPAAGESVRNALSSRQGVFRKFKDALRNYPDIERQWFVFKESHMQNYVRTWYNELRELRGLEKIGSEPEETDDILATDFSFSRRPVADIQEFINQCMTQFCLETAEIYSSDIAKIMQLLTESAAITLLQSAESQMEKNALLASAADGTPAGFLSLCQYEKTICINEFYVMSEYRGLGLATSMISQCIADCTARGIKRLGIIAFPGSKFYLQSLETRGFVQHGSMLFLEL